MVLVDCRFGREGAGYVSRRVSVRILRSIACMSVAALCVFAGLGAANAATLREVVEKAVRTSPTVAAVMANRRATEFELRQSEGQFLPRVDLEGETGGERIDRPNGFSADVNDEWRNRRSGQLTLSQILFDGWERSNDVYRNSARVSSAAFRVAARSELVALDAIEAYIDVRRHTRVIKLAQDSLAMHRRVLSRVSEQQQAGKVADSDVLQVKERVAASEAGIARVRQSLYEAEAKFLRVVGEPPRDLQPAGYPAGVPATRLDGHEAGLSNSPVIAAAQADAEAARFSFEQSLSARYPTVTFEARGLTGADLAGTPGPDNEVSAKVVLRWNVFDGFITRHRQFEFAERLAQADAEREERVRLVREEIDRSFAAYYAGGQRLEPLRRQLSLSSSVVTSYETEYGLAKRSLLDLLNAENSRFNVAVEVTNTEALHVLSSYRILAAMGGLLEVLGIAPPVEADPDATTAGGYFNR